MFKRLRDAEGGLRLRSGAQRFFEGAIGFTFPMLFSGVADVREWFDEKASCFRIEVDVRNNVWGPLFGYRGASTSSGGRRQRFRDEDFRDPARSFIDIS